MAIIGTFTTSEDGFTGTLRTLSFQAKVSFVPNSKGSGNAPDYRLVHVSHAQCLHHDSFRALINCAAKQTAICTPVHGHDLLDRWHDIGLDFDVLSAQRLPREDHTVGVDLSKKAVVTGLKGFIRWLYGSGYVPRSVDLVVHGQQDPLSFACSSTAIRTVLSRSRGPSKSEDEALRCAPMTTTGLSDLTVRSSQGPLLRAAPTGRVFTHSGPGAAHWNLSSAAPTETAVEK